MTPENFIYWLQGYLELSNAESISSDQIKQIKDHLALVLEKVTPDRSQPGDLTKSLQSLQPDPEILDFIFDSDPSYHPKLCSAKLPEHPGKPFKKQPGQGRHPKRYC